MFNHDKKFGAFIMSVFAVLVGTGLALQFFSLPSSQTTTAKIYTLTVTTPSPLEHQAAESSKTETLPETHVNIFPIDINTAGVQELILLDGIGEVIAQRIIDYRAAGNYFYSIDDIKKVSGIGDGIFLKIKEKIIVWPDRLPIQTILTTPPSRIIPETSMPATTAATALPPQTSVSTVKGTHFPIDINMATPQELMSLNGIGERLAARIIVYREEISAFYSIEDIMNVPSIGTALFEKIKNQIYVDTSLLPPLIPSTDDLVVVEVPVINLNTAKAQDLELLPKITPEIAQKILYLRDNMIGGQFTSIFELLYIEGLTNEIFEAIQDYITV